MINFYISYFYQIRNMASNMLPISTAMYDPTWFHNGKGVGYRYLDKNNVINGVRMNELCMEAYKYEFLIKANADCKTVCSENSQSYYEKEKSWCPFMASYATCIREKNPDFQKFITFCEDYLRLLNHKFNFGLDTIIFIVHEPPSRNCGERPVLQQWFEENGYELKEWSKDL